MKVLYTSLPDDTSCDTFVSVGENCSVLFKQILCVSSCGLVSVYAPVYMCVCASVHVCVCVCAGIKSILNQKELAPKHTLCTEATMFRKIKRQMSCKVMMESMVPEKKYDALDCEGLTIVNC